MGGNFREMLYTVIRINFRGSNFRGTRVRAIDADDVIWKLVHVAWWPKYSFNDIALHCIAWVRRYFVSKRRVGDPVLEKNYHANARMATILIAVSYWPRFSSPGPVISITTRGTAGDRGACQSRTLSTGCSHAGTATKSRTVYLNDGT